LLIEKKIDFGILSVPQVNRSFRYLPLVDEPVHLVGSTEHHPRKKTWQLKDLSNIPLVLAPAPHGSRLVIDQMLRKHGVKAKIVLESEVWSVIKDVVQKGIAYTLVPRREVREEIKRGSLKAETISKPEIRHGLLLARLTKGAHTPFDNEVFEFLAPSLQQALIERARI
jgi:LysR family nitrogen assimilation transcriptional regulator